MDMHLFYFDPATVGRLVDQAGLRLVAVRPYRQVVSLGYLLEKLAASFPTGRAGARWVAAAVPRSWMVPIVVDNATHFVAVRR
jgi:hypothetical protein